MARFTYHCPVRWSDMDAFGHVNNARVLTLYEEARVALMFRAARAQGLTSMAQGVVIARHEVDYLRPVDHSESVRIDLWVEQLRWASFTLGYELFDDGQVASRARSVLVPYDLAAGRARRLSPEEREFLTPYLENGG